MAFAIGDEELGQGLRLICIGSPLPDIVLDAQMEYASAATFHL